MPTAVLASAPPNRSGSLDELIHALADIGLPGPTLAGLTGDLRSVARLLGRRPDEVEGTYRQIRAAIEDAPHRKGGISRKTKQNLCSSLRRAFVMGGWFEPLDDVEPSPDWTAAKPLLRSKFERSSLGLFMKFCSRAGIGPEDVTDAVLEYFYVEMTTVEWSKDPALMVRRVAKVLNGHGGTTPGWPATRLTATDRRRTWAIPWDRLPAALRARLEEFLARQGGADPFDDDAPPSPLKPSTLAMRRNQIRWWISALQQAGWEVGRLSSIEEIVTPEAFKAALRQLLARAETAGATTQPGAIGLAMLGVARYAAGVKGEALEILRRLVRRVRTRHRGLAPRNEAMLREVTHPEVARNLVLFPLRTLAAVEREGGRSMRAALRAQTAVAVEILLRTGMRAGNLVALDLDRHLVRIRGRSGDRLHLVIPGEEVKNGEDLAFELPPDSVRLLEAYLRDWRPVLASAGNRYLFPGKGLGHKVRHRLAERVTAELLDATGVHLTPHQFRHLLARYYLDRNPTGHEVVRRFLGHSSIKSTVDYYASQDRVAANRLFDAVVDGIRAGGAAAPPTGRPRRREA